MTRPTARARTGADRTLRTTALVVALLWLVAMIVTDGIQQGTTRNIITDAASAQALILGHQTVILLESMASLYLAALLVVLGSVLRRVLGSTVVFGATVLSAVAIVLGSVVSFAEVAAAHHHDHQALMTLGYLVAFAWTWEGAAWGFLLLASGYVLLRRKAAPRWFAITTLVLGVPVVVGFGTVLFWGLAPVWFALVAFLVRESPSAAVADPVRDATEPVAAGRS